MNIFRSIALRIGIITLISNIGIGIITDFEVRCQCDSKCVEKCYTENFEGLLNSKSEFLSYVSLNVRFISLETKFITSLFDNISKLSDPILSNIHSATYSSDIISNRVPTIRD
jgi:predicted transcriptional regulator